MVNRFEIFPIIIRGSYYRIFEKFIKIIALISIIDIENYVFMSR